jgi:AhpD family alkylhydroperoxidase
MNTEEFNIQRHELMQKMKETDPFFEEFGKLDDKTFGDGIIPKKYKELTMLTVSIFSKCEECIVFHCRECIDNGAMYKELLEAIKMGMMAGGSVTYPYARQAFGLIAGVSEI